MMTIQIMQNTPFPPTVDHTRDTTKCTEPSLSYNCIQMEHLRQKNLQSSIIPYTLCSFSSLAPAEII